MQVVDDRRRDLAAVTRAAPQMPVHEAEQALAGELRRAREGAEMGVGEVGQHEHGCEDTRAAPVTQPFRLLSSILGRATPKSIAGRPRQASDRVIQTIGIKI